MAEIIKHHLLSSLEKHKHNDALSIGKNTWSYEQLFSPVIQLRTEFSLLFDGQQAIGVLADKSLLGYQCIIAAFIAGKTYVPLNVDYPVQRNAHIIDQAQIATIIVSPNCEQQAKQIFDELDGKVNVVLLRDNQQQTTIEHIACSEETEHNSMITAQTAYVLFTSGSTGKPKAVPISDQNIDSYLSAITKQYHFKTTDRFTQFFAFTFDLSIHDMLVCWLSGACLCPADKMGLLMPLQFAKKQRITVWFSVPSLAQTAKDLLKKRFSRFRLADIRYSFFCGEALPTNIADDWLIITHDKPVINLYGPTEATIAFTAFEHSKEKTNNNSVVSIGKTFGENSCAIFDTNGCQLTDHQSGELCLSGPQVFDGYLNSDKQFNEVFYSTNNQGKTIKWYRTGDIVSKLNDGNIKYHGRNDRQVQLKGFRVELQEVEHHLGKILPNTNIAVVAYSTLGNEEHNVLTAFVQNQKHTEAEILSLCNDVLPYYMIPENIVFLPNFPHNDSGKLDYKELRIIAKQHN